MLCHPKESLPPSRRYIDLIFSTLTDFIIIIVIIIVVDLLHMTAA